jgi:MerR family transcriptional regulator, light-induced transcriptional regulator
MAEDRRTQITDTDRCYNEVYTGFASGDAFGSDHTRIQPNGNGHPGWARGLEKTIAAEIIPRLMLAHREPSAKPESPRWDTDRRPDAGDVTEFTRLVLNHDIEIARAYADSLCAQGVPVEVLYLDLIAPSAKLLGEMWKADLCDFMDVTLGLTRLQQIARMHLAAFEAECDEVPVDDRKALLVSVPGEHHTLGVFLVEAFLRRSGWNVRAGPPLSSEELIVTVRREWFSVIGLSISADNLIEQLASAIRSIRRQSCNQGIGIMVGGRVFVDHPEWISLVGADTTAVDARQAVAAAENMVGIVEGRC